MLTDDAIYEIVAEVLGQPLIVEDLREGFSVHTEPRDWIKFARALESRASNAGGAVAYIPDDALTRLTPPLLVLDGVRLYRYNGVGTTALYLRPAAESDKRECPQPEICRGLQCEFCVDVGERWLHSVNIDAAARTLAECMDYPWEPMPEQGRLEMKKHARRVIDAAMSREQSGDDRD